ncbi:MAG: ABC transporter substrate-binding protein [Deltaproteobacteria bacterium]|nr:ABC transporter substrate-binding protein [Deltaproteobacteria bacterium]
MNKIILRFLWVFVAVLPVSVYAATVNVAVPSYSMSLVAFMVAKERGYYRQEGLDVNFVLMPAPIASRALIGGNVEFATVGGSALTASLGGAPLRLLFSSFNRSLFWLYSKPEIAEVKDLKGKKIGVSGIGAGPDSMLRDMLTKHGLQGGKDVAILAMGVDTSRYASLVNGVTDAVLLSTPYNFVAQDAGFRELVSFVKQDWVELQGCIVTRESVLRTDAALVEKLTLATLKGLLYVRSNRAGSLPTVAAMMKVNPDLAAKIYDLSIPAMTTYGALSEELQKKAIEHVVKQMNLKDPPNLQKLYDFTHAEKARRQLEAQGWKP